MILNTHLGRINLNPTTYLLNNWWGKTSSTVGSQTMEDLGPNSWRTDFNWIPPTQYNVISYSAAITGWHQNQASGLGQAGLPVGLSEKKHVFSDFSFKLTPITGLRYNVSYDLWLNSKANPLEPGVARREVMIWLAYSRDLGLDMPFTQLGEWNGIKWKYQARLPNLDTFYVDGADVSEGSIDIKKFLDYLVSVGRVDPTWYLTGIEFGPEVYRGQGSLVVENYTVEASDALVVSPMPDLSSVFYW